MRTFIILANFILDISFSIEQILFTISYVIVLFSLDIMPSLKHTVHKHAHI